MDTTRRLPPCITSRPRERSFTPTSRPPDCCPLLNQFLETHGQINFVVEPSGQHTRSIFLSSTKFPLNCGRTRKSHELSTVTRPSYISSPPSVTLLFSKLYHSGEYGRLPENRQQPVAERKTPSQENPSYSSLQKQVVIHMYNIKRRCRSFREQKDTCSAAALRKSKMEPLVPLLRELVFLGRAATTSCSTTPQFPQARCFLHTFTPEYLSLQHHLQRNMVRFPNESRAAVYRSAG